MLGGSSHRGSGCSGGSSCRGFGQGDGDWDWGRGRGVKGEGAGDISSTLPYTALPHGASPMVLRPKGTSHNNDTHISFEQNASS